jgi:uncharacterized protein YcbK (DUF882 family)
MKCSLYALFGLLLLPAVHAPLTADTPPTPEFRLRMFHTHTQEHIDIVYRRGGEYLADGLARLNRFLRDHRTGDIHAYDPRVFDLLADLTRAVGRAGAELHIICGYRTPWSNEYLRKNSDGVAKNSLHMAAEAIDIRLPGVPIAQLRDAALELKRGGVGYYAASNFIHVDVGRVRRW